MVKRTPAQASENLVLFLTLVPFVMDRGEVTVAEAARQFDRSPDDIRRAVELIACAGVPGDSSAYLHADLFDIDWDAFENQDVIRFEHTVVIDQQPRLSAREVSALIAGLQYLAAHPRYGERQDVHELLAKLRGARLDRMDEDMVVAHNGHDDVKTIVVEAIEQGRQIHFDYVNKNGESDRRRVDPITLEARDDVWYVRGWCHTREALRLFRLDRMAALELTSEPVASHPEVDHPESWRFFDPSETDLPVTLWVEGAALPVIAEYLDRSARPEPDGEGFLVTIPFAHERSLVHLVASHPGLIRVVEPAPAREAVANWARRALEGAR